MEYPYDVILRGKKCVDLYDECIGNGCTPKMAEMLALQQPPGAMTDREFFEGIGTLADQFKGEEHNLKLLVKAAKAKGYTPGTNDFYNPNLAKEFADPLAFIPPTGGRNHLRRVCEMRGDACEGAVTVQRQEREPPKRKKLADDIALDAAKKMAAKDPALRQKTKSELIRMAVDKHGQKES